MIHSDDIFGLHTHPPTILLLHKICLQPHSSTMIRCFCVPWTACCWTNVNRFINRIEYVTAGCWLIMATARLLPGDVWCIREWMWCCGWMLIVFTSFSAVLQASKTTDSSPRSVLLVICWRRQNVVVHVVNSAQLETFKCRTRTTQFLQYRLTTFL